MGKDNLIETVSLIITEENLVKIPIVKNEIRETTEIKSYMPIQYSNRSAYSSC